MAGTDRSVPDPYRGAAGPTEEPAAGRSALRAAFAAAVAATDSDHRELPDGGDLVSELVSDARRRGDDRVALSPSLAATEGWLRPALSAAGVRVIVPGDDDPAAAVADVPVGVVRGELGIAETGSVLIAEHLLADRVVSMLCTRVVQVVRSEDVVARLEDAARWLSQHARGTSAVSLMSGPSRTADIERSLTIGVQGPQEVGVRVLTAPRVPSAEGPTSVQR